MKRMIESKSYFILYVKFGVGTNKSNTLILILKKNIF